MRSARPFRMSFGWRIGRKSPARTHYDVERVMLTYISRAVIFLLLIGVTIAAAQAPEKKPESISTEPALLIVELKTADGNTVKISGEAVFNLEEANSDDTMTGKLTYAISSDSRQEIAQVMNRPLQKIPEHVTVSDVFVEFVKNASCPDLQVVYSAFRAKEIELAGAKARLDRSRLTFRETSEELSKLLCKWAWGISRGGFHGRSPINAINRRLKGEKEEQ